MKVTRDDLKRRYYEWKPTHKPETDKSKDIDAFPHYRRSKHARIGAESLNVFDVRTGTNTPDGAYLDRMQQWDCEKYSKACDKADEDHPRSRYGKRCALFFERLLQLYYDDESIKILVVTSGVRRDNGYPWTYLGWSKDE